MNKKTFTLRDYIDKIERKYINSRADYEGTAKELQALTELHKEYASSPDYSYEGKQKEREKYEVRSRELKNTIESISRDFRDYCNQVYRESDTIFDNKYEMNPDSIDDNFIRYLSLGTITEKKLLEFANRYKADDNITMYRICGEYAEKNLPESPDIRKMITDVVMSSERVDHHILDSYIDICLKGLRDDINLANGIHDRHEELIRPLQNSSDLVTCDVISPW